jgi:hypothetical protein
MGVVPFSSSFGDYAQVLVERSTFLLVIEQILINRFMTYAKQVETLQGIADLLRAELHPEQEKHHFPLFFGKVGSSS